MLEYAKRIIRKMERMIKFSFVGALNVSVSLITYYILLKYMVHIQIANFVAFFVGTLNGYVWNKFWVFKARNRSVNEMLKFYGVYIFSWLLSALLLYFWVEILNVSKELAPIINIFITMPINYLLSRNLVFQKDKNINKEE